MFSASEGQLQWSCLGCGRSGAAVVKVRAVGSFTPSEWNYFHELSTAEHEAVSLKETGAKCRQPITWDVKALPMRISEPR
jgi:hypothetical protein